MRAKCSLAGLTSPGSTRCFIHDTRCAARGCFTHRSPYCRAVRLLSTSPNQVLTHAARAAAKQLNKHLFLATNMCLPGSSWLYLFTTSRERSEKGARKAKRRERRAEPSKYVRACARRSNRIHHSCISDGIDLGHFVDQVEEG